MRVFIVRGKTDHIGAGATVHVIKGTTHHYCPS
jgi:hypothetical protein